MATNKRDMHFAESECSYCRSSQQELKCLPCSHNICTNCLLYNRQGSHGSSGSIHCPIDESEFLLSNGGIDSLPTKGMLVEVSSDQESSGNDEKEKFEIRNEFTDAFDGMEETFLSSLKHHENRLKADIRSTALQLVKAISAQEQRLYKEVENCVEAEKQARQDKLVDFAGQGLDSRSSDFQTGGPWGVKLKATNNSAFSQARAIIERKRSLKKIQNAQNSSNMFSFKVNKEYVQDVINKPFGNLEYTKSFRERTVSAFPRVERTAQQLNKAGKVIRCFALPSPFNEKFRPWVVAVSESGHVAVVDRGNNCIHIFNPKGNFLRHVGFGGHGKGLGVYGVTFLSRNTLATAEYSPTTGSGRLLEYNISGEPLRVLGNLRGPAQVTSVPSSAKAGKKIVAVYYMTSLEPAEVFCIDEGNGDLPSVPGEIKGLLHPHKGVFLDVKFIVSDTDGGKNQGCVKVFDSSAQLTGSFGEHRLWNGRGLGHPLRIAADPANCSVLSYHASTARMVVYDTSGKFLSQFNTISGLVDFAVTPDGKLIASCGENSEFPNTVVVLSYR